MVSKFTNTAIKHLIAAKIDLTEEQYLAVTDVMEMYAKKVHEKTLKSVSDQFEQVFDDIIDTSNMLRDDRDTWSNIFLQLNINHGFDKIEEIIENEFNGL